MVFPTIFPTIFNADRPLPRPLYKCYKRRPVGYRPLFCLLPRLLRPGTDLYVGSITGLLRFGHYIKFAKFTCYLPFIYRLLYLPTYVPYTDPTTSYLLKTHLYLPFIFIRLLRLNTFARPIYVPYIEPTAGLSRSAY